MRRKLVLSDNAIKKAQKWVSDRAQIEKLHQGPVLYDEILFWTVTQAPQVGSSIKNLKLKKFKL